MLKVLRQIGLGCCISLTWISFGFAEIVTVEASGVGQTRAQAVTNGLVEAVQKATGVRIDQFAVTGLNQKILQIDLKENEASGRSNTSKQFSGTVKLSEGIDAIASQSGGAIRSYIVVSAQDDNRGNIIVKLKVDVEKFKSVLSDQAKRIRLIVAEFSGLDPEAALRLQDALKAYFVQARRFSVVDRSENAEYVKEMALVTGPSASLTERVRYGQVLGADFILTGKVKVSKNIAQLADPVTQKIIVRETVSADLTFSLIEIATRQILWTNSIQMGRMGNIHAALDQAVPLIGKQASETLFPLRVIASDDPNALIINQGGLGVVVGQKFALMELGRELVDPDTKSSLGRQESQVGFVEITRVNPNVSYGKVLTGKYTKGAALILRDVVNDGKTEVGGPTTVRNPGTRSKAFDD